MIVIDNLDIGGAQRLLEIQVTQMGSAHRILVVNLAQETPLAERLRALGAEVMSVKLRKMMDIGHVLRLTQTLQAWKPDMIHAHLLHSAFVSALAARRLGVPLVITLHNETLDVAGIMTRIKNRLEQYVLSHRADVVIACGPRVGRSQRNRVGRTPLVTVANRISPIQRLSLDETQELRHAAGFGPDSLVVLAAGRLTVQKGFDLLLDAFVGVVRTCPKARLMIAGEGVMGPDLARKITRLGLGEHVQLLGPIPDVERKLQIADVFVLPSRHEGLPMILLEAMSAGCPIVATKVGDIETLLDANSALLVRPESVSDLESALIRMLQDKDLRDRVGANALAASQTYTDVTSFVSGLEAVYTKAVTSHANPN